MKGFIESGQWKVGERLPATRELAGTLGVNRATVAAAYELLESEGLIKGHVGRGSFVAAENPAGRRLDWTRLLGHDPVPLPSAPVPAGAISFAASRPSARLFPVEDLRACCREVLEGPQAAAILQLGSPGGYEPLRRYLLEVSQSEGVLGAEDDLIVTSGCQQALDLIARVLLRDGDPVAVEDPVYPGLKNLFLDSGTQLTGIPMTAAGIDLAELGRAIARRRPKLVVVTSNFQNPTGATLSIDARRQLIRATRDAGAVLVENDIYGGLRYHGEPLPAIRKLDESAQTVLLRSFSKVSFPGLRVGWVIGPRPLIGRLLEAKQLSDLHTDHLSQAVLLRFAESGRLEAHRQRMLQAGTERLRAVLEGCQRWLPPGSEFTRPEGGMNVWLRLPEPLDASELLLRVQRENVTYLPGKYFAVSRSAANALRLSFAGLEPGEIAQGVRILGAVFSNEMERWSVPRGMDPAPAIV
jgi:2-aminoadipate transaminase